MKKTILTIKEKIIPILKSNRVVRAGIFGSASTGHLRKNSDIDILIKFKGGESLLDLVELENKLEKKLQRKVDLLTYNSINPLLKNRILKEEIQIL